MITINATVGIGLYWRAGTILQVGGPLTLLLSYFCSGFVAWSVMQCVAELLCLWPLPGALPLYVAEFVDPELAAIVGFSYWCVHLPSIPSHLTMREDYTASLDDADNDPGSLIQYLSQHSSQPWRQC